MNKKIKIYIIILSIFTIIFGVLLFLIAIKQKGEERIVDYPVSNLSDSIFDSQNTTYVPNESLPVAHSFSHIPYTIDTVDTNGVIVDTGTIYAINSSQYLFYSEIIKGADISSELAHQFAQVLEYNVSNSDVTYSVIKEETGYINGFSAQYDIIKVSVPSGNEIKSAVIVAYTLLTEDQDDYEMLYDLSVCSVTTVEETEVLEQCKQLALIDIGTIQYSETLKKELIEELNKLQREDSEVEENTETGVADELDEEGSEETDNSAESVGTDVETETEEDMEEIVVSGENQNDSESVESQNSDTETVSPDDSELKKMALHLKQNYENLSLSITWSNSSQIPSITVTSPSGEHEYNATGVSNGKCQVYIGEAPAGVYVVRIGNYDACGEFSFELQEN